MVNCWEQKKKTPDNAGVFQLQAALQGMGGSTAWGILDIGRGAWGFKPYERGLIPRLWPHAPCLASPPDKWIRILRRNSPP